MKCFRFISVLAMSIVFFTIFNGCSDDDKDDSKNQNLDICDVFAVYEGTIKGADVDLPQAKIVVSYQSDNNLIVLSPVAETTNFPVLKFSVETLNIEDEILTFISKEYEIRFFLTDQINLVVKSLKGSYIDFSGTESSDDAINIEKPSFCGVNDLMKNVYTTYIGSASTADNEVFEHVKIEVKREGNVMIIKSSTHKSFATAKINLIDFNYKDGCFECDGAEYAQFCEQTRGIACGLIIKGKDGLAYNFLGATWNPY